MKKNIFILLILALFLTFSAAFVSADEEKPEEQPLPLLTAVPEEKLILPGEGLGKIRFGASIHEVEKIFGRGKIIPMEADFSGNKVINLTYDDQGLSFSFDSGGLSLIGIKTPGFATKEGLQVGIDVGDVIRVLGTGYNMQKSLMDTSSMEEKAYDLYYDTISINVKGNIVKMIKIRTKRTGKKK